ncbi:MAG: threonine/serine exporter family protein [Anaerostipes sp.]|nr:threonine/serine exporter family protein [Anaerostipes sp.]
MNLKKILVCAMDIGALMLSNGAGVSRVEDTIERICRAYGAKNVEVFSITSSILTTVTTKEGDVFTQTKRIKQHAIDFKKLDELNALSRHICFARPGIQFINDEIERIDKIEAYTLPIRSAISALIAGVFTIFFGGGIMEAVIAAMAGFIGCVLMHFLNKYNANEIFSNFLTIFMVGSIAIIAVHFRLAGNYGHIIIGNIMLLVPGVGFVNSIRDVIGGDTIAGMIRLCEVIVIAVFLAGGSFAALMLWEGIL